MDRACSTNEREGEGKEEKCMYVICGKARKKNATRKTKTPVGG
jgi:hypothetical protein